MTTQPSRPPKRDALTSLKNALFISYPTRKPLPAPPPPITTITAPAPPTRKPPLPPTSPRRAPNLRTATRHRRNRSAVCVEGTLIDGTRKNPPLPSPYAEFPNSSQESFSTTADEESRPTTADTSLTSLIGGCGNEGGRAIEDEDLKKYWRATQIYADSSEDDENYENEDEKGVEEEQAVEEATTNSDDVSASAMAWTHSALHRDLPSRTWNTSPPPPSPPSDPPSPPDPLPAPPTGRKSYETTLHPTVITTLRLAPSQEQRVTSPLKRLSEGFLDRSLHLYGQEAQTRRGRGRVEKVEKIFAERVEVRRRVDWWGEYVIDEEDGGDGTERWPTRWNGSGGEEDEGGEGVKVGFGELLSSLEAAR